MQRKLEKGDTGGEQGRTHTEKVDGREDIKAGAGLLTPTLQVATEIKHEINTFKTGCEATPPATNHGLNAAPKSP